MVDEGLGDQSSLSLVPILFEHLQNEVEVPKVSENAFHKGEIVFVHSLHADHALWDVLQHSSMIFGSCWRPWYHGWRVYVVAGWR